MRRVAIVIGLLVGLAATTAGCSTTAAKAGLPVCGSYNPTTHITATPPCTPPTTTTLPPALPLGKTATLSTTWSYTAGTYGSSATATATVGGRFVINRIWTEATPELSGIFTEPPGWTLAQAVSLLLSDTHLPIDQQVMWLGVDLDLTNTGTVPIQLGGADGSGVTALYFVVNSRGPRRLTDSRVDLTESGFEVGVQGCPYPFPSASASWNPGQSFSGCVALAVPVGVKVFAVGFRLSSVGAVRWAV